MDKNLKSSLKVFCYLFTIFLLLNLNFSYNLAADVVTMVKSDYANFYGESNLRSLTLAFSVGAVWANSSWDQNVQNWYQRKCRNSNTDEISTLFKFWGEGYNLVPISVLAASMQLLPSESDLLRSFATWGKKNSRAYLTGAPFLLLMQRVTGGSRPSEADGSSQWDFFADENGVSGHAFIGAIPFLTMAEMNSHNKILYWTSALLSTLPALSRINDDKHYFSQAFLGWFIAKQAVEAVSDTDKEEAKLTFIPVMKGGELGVMLAFQW